MFREPLRVLRIELVASKIQDEQAALGLEPPTEQRAELVDLGLFGAHHLIDIAAGWLSTGIPELCSIYHFHVNRWRNFPGMTCSLRSWNLDGCFG